MICSRTVLRSLTFLLIANFLPFSPDQLPIAKRQPFTNAASLSPADQLEERIQRIEKGLLPPPVFVKGEPLPVMNLVERMKFYRTPGVSIAVINDGKLEWARGYGVKELGQPTPITPETLFQAGSISKPVSALAALRLVEEGKLRLDEDVNQKLVSWKVPENDFTKEKKVTLRGLLTHSAGLTVHGFPGYATDAPVPTTVQIFDGAKPANTTPVRVNLVPGSQWRYSGGGYTVMQQLLVDVSGKPFPQLLKEKVLDPLNMKHSTFEQPPSKSWAEATATAHLSGEKVKGRWHVYPEMAAAGLWTTPSDLALYILEVQKSLSGKSNKVLSQAMTQQMLTVQIQNYGLGPSLSGSGETARFAHGGVDEGFEAYFVAYTTKGQGAVVMTNSNRGSALAQEIVRGIAREYKWTGFLPEDKAIAKVDPKILENYVGVYQGNQNLLSYVTMEDGQLYLQRTGGVKVKLLPESETEFFARGSGFRLTFDKDAGGKVTQLTVVQQNNSKNVSPKTDKPQLPIRKPVAVNAKILSTYVGNYLIEGGFALRVLWENNKLWLEPPGEERRELLAESETEFFIQNVDAQVKFVRNEKGEITGLVFHQVRDIKAEKAK